MPLLKQLNVIGFSIGAVIILNIVLMFIVPYSYVFFGLQSIILFTAFLFFIFAVHLYKDSLAYSRKILGTTMVYCAFLEVPTWACGIIVFCLNQKNHHLDVTWFIVGSVAYMIIPISLFGAF